MGVESIYIPLHDFHSWLDMEFILVCVDFDSINIFIFVLSLVSLYFKVLVFISGYRFVLISIRPYRSSV